MFDLHACSASCPCQRDKEIAARVASRHLLSLDLGRSVFTVHLKLHHFSGSLQITDMDNAGKRGKKVRILSMIPQHVNDAHAEIVIKPAVAAILHMTYDQAKAHLEKLLQEQEGGGKVNLFSLDEHTVRGIDVEPPGTKIELQKKFPNGTIITISATSHDFHVNDSVMMQVTDRNTGEQ